MFDLTKLDENQVRSLYWRATDQHYVEALDPTELLPKYLTIHGTSTDKEGLIRYVQAYLDAKMKIYVQRPELVYEDFNKRLQFHKGAELFLTPAKGRDTIAHMLNCYGRQSIHPDTFAQALAKPIVSDSRYMDIVIDQARELAYMTEKPLTETMKERLIQAGLTPFQAGVLTDVTHAYETNTHEHFVTQMKTIHGAEAARLEAARLREQTSVKELEDAATTAANTAEHALPAEEIASAKIEQTAEGLWARIVNMHLGAKIVIGVGAAAAVAGAGYWALKVRNKERNKLTSDRAVASGRQPF